MLRFALDRIRNGDSLEIVLMMIEDDLQVPVAYPRVCAPCPASRTPLFVVAGADFWVP